MNATTEINIFRKECEKRNVDVDSTFLLGRGSGCYGGRYRQSVGIDKLQNSHLYVIQYCKDINLFVAWKLKNTSCRREKYSIKKADLTEICDDELHIIGKFVQYSGWENENVIAFNSKAISKFIEKYVSPEYRLSKGENTNEG